MRSNRVSGDGNRDVSVTNIGGECVSTDNPFPIMSANALIPNKYDYVTVTSATLSDTYTFKIGGSSGTTVATIRLTFTSSTKASLSSVEKL